MRMRKTLIFVCFLVLAQVASVVTSQEANSFKVVVNAENPATALPASQISKFFLKQATSWDHGGRVAPVDLAESSAARATFSDEILGRTVAAVESYWQQQIYSGRAVPPVKVGSDAEVVAYVQANPGAIGYVSAAADTATVKEIAIDG